MTDQFDCIVGCNDALIDYAGLNVPVHRDVVAPFLTLQRRARQQGFELTIVSGFRSFERQLRIWNEKARGERTVLDDSGRVLDLQILSPWEQVQAILRWSALPGGSRHHWGTDIDVYDSAAVPADYRVQLTAAEAGDDGPFGPLHRWLDAVLTESDSRFFRPYDRDRGGTAPERWHLSYAPLAAPIEQALTRERLKRFIAEQPLDLKDTVLDHFDEIFARFVKGVGKGVD